MTATHKMNVLAVLRGEKAAIHADGFDISPPSDDRPFFFYIGMATYGAKVPLLFCSILAVILLAGFVLVFKPLQELERLRPAGDRVTVSSARMEMTYFAA
ncbi:MAG: hypothetical protein ABR587_17010, partial [Candidatus Binatia bacterium]